MLITSHYATFPRGVIRARHAEKIVIGHLPPTDNRAPGERELHAWVRDVPDDVIAKQLGLPLLTDDAKFASAAGHLAEIHHYPN